MANNDPIGKKLNMNSLPSVPDSNSIVSQMMKDAHADSAKQDFETARANLIVQMDSANEAILTLQEIAKRSQHPRAFEVLANLINTSMAASKQLLDLQSKIRDIENSEENTNEAANITNNNLYLTTSELQKMMKNANEIIEIEKNEDENDDS